jgi:hypothetical protein
MNTKLDTFITSKTFDEVVIIIEKLINKYGISAVNDNSIIDNNSGIGWNSMRDYNFCRIKYDNNSFFLYLALSNNLTSAQETISTIGLDKFQKYFNHDNGVIKFLISIIKNGEISSSIWIGGHKLRKNIDVELVRNFIGKLIEIVDNNDDVIKTKSSKYNF